MRIRKKVTEKKAKANRENGKKHSTGPRTPRGKNASKFNAVKLGLFAKHVFIPLCDGAGSEAEFERLLADLQQEYQPQGPSEKFCVEVIAECMWKLRRVVRTEKSWILNAVAWEGTPPDPNALAQVPLKIRAFLKSAKEEIKTTGTLSPGDYARVLGLMPLPPTDRAHGKIDDEFLASLDQSLKLKDDDIGDWFRIAKVMKEDYYAGHALPPEGVTHLIHRSDKAAQRKFDWALQRLLESQRRRLKG